MGAKLEPNEHGEFKVFVKNLPWSATEDMLYETFGGVGEVSFARLCVDIDTGDSKGFGFVSFKDRDAAERAIKELTGQNIDGRDIQVLPSTPRGKDTSRTKSRRSPPPCFNYQKGSCKFGERCRFSHGEEAPADTEVKKPKAGVCFKFQIGSCKFGEQCKFSHDLIEASKNPLDTSESPNGKVKKAALSKDVQGGKPKGDDASTDNEEPDAEIVSTNGSRKRQESVAEKDRRTSKKKRKSEEETPDVESSPEEQKQKKKKKTKKKKLLGKATVESAKSSNKKRSRANDEVIGESPEKPKKRARTGDEPKKKKKKKATSELKQLSSQGAQADETLSDDVERFAKGKRKKKGEAVISKDKDKSDKKPKKKKKKKVKAKATTLEGNDSTVKSSNPKSKKKSKKKKVSKES